MNQDVIMEKRLTFSSNQEVVSVLGKNDEFLRLISENFSARITPRGNEIIILGAEKEADSLIKLFNDLIFLLHEGTLLTVHDVKYAIRMVKEGCQEYLQQMYAETVIMTVRGKQIKPKTLGQKHYLEAIRNNFITFGIGPAGTGKTYLAVAMAVNSLKNKETERIVLTHPAVEAGEKLGFLPGDLQDKVDPYLRPLYDALYDILGYDTVQKYLSKNIIEIAPLAYMRGRNLDDCFIILDEAQNTTPEQMKMCLTRLGFGSRMVVTGDITQIDLPRNIHSGLKHAQKVLAQVQGIRIVELNETDVVRHEIVSRIIRAYVQFEANSL